MSKILIERTSPDDIKIRGLDVQVDNLDIYNLTYGKSVEIEVPAGVHTLHARNGLYKADEKLVLADQQTMRIEVSNVASGVSKFAFFMLGAGPYRVFIRRLN